MFKKNLAMINVIIFVAVIGMVGSMGMDLLPKLMEDTEVVGDQLNVYYSYQKSIIIKTGLTPDELEVEIVEGVSFNKEFDRIKEQLSDIENLSVEELNEIFENTNISVSIEEVE